MNNQSVDVQLALLSQKMQTMLMHNLMANLNMYIKVQTIESLDLALYLIKFIMCIFMLLKSQQLYQHLMILYQCRNNIVMY